MAKKELSLAKQPLEPSYPDDPKPNPIPDRSDPKPEPMQDPRTVPKPARPTDPPLSDPEPLNPKW